MLYIFFVISFACVNKICAEQYNLYGDAGQAYAIEVNLGHPYQKLRVLVDTGSTTLAIATQPWPQNDVYFRTNRSSSLFNSGKEVQTKYSQGVWWGTQASDLIQFPSISSVPEVRTNMALITKSKNIFEDAWGWQGLLGLAYLPIGAWGDSIVVESWLDSLDRTTGKPMSFKMKLCGSQSSSNVTSYGNFWIVDDQTVNQNTNITFKTPIIRKEWYEIAVIAVKVLTKRNKTQDEIDTLQEVDDSMCRRLNLKKNIVDSGTTNLKLPQEIFRQVVDDLKNAAKTSNVLILDNFWHDREAACWPEPQNWSLPYLAIDLLSADADNQYFTLEIPPQNYIRLVKTRNNTEKDGVVSEYCYNLGLSATTETILGYSAMEGFEILFNRSAGWIGFQTSSCGPNTRITGPYNTSSKLSYTCDIYKPNYEVAVSIKAAQWALFGVSIVASGVLIYVLAPCIRTILVKRLPRSQQMSLSQAALVSQESN